MYFGDKNILFVHIPKCGGNTVMDYFGYREPDNPKVHYTAEEYNKENKIKFKSSFVFTIVRNKYQQLVSMYFYCREKYQFVKEMTFEEFVFSNDVNVLHLRDVLRQTKYIFNQKKELIVSFIGDINNCQESFSQICLKIDKKFNTDIPHSNKTKKDDYRTYLNNKIIEKINEDFRQEIEYFGYDPEDLSKIKNIGFIKKQACKFL